jgi:Fe-S-cluster containining protein
MHMPYTQLLQHADEQFDRVAASHPTSFTCKQGCHACCEPGLSVLKVEADNISQFIQLHPEIKIHLQTIQESNPHNGTRCSMLDKDGKCVIYPVRPFICRSHGAPIAIAREEYYQIDVCPLNFTENPIEELGPEDFFILDDWNDLLCANNNTDTRIPLDTLIDSDTKN